MIDGENVTAAAVEREWTPHPSEFEPAPGSTETQERDNPRRPRRGWLVAAGVVLAVLVAGLAYSGLEGSDTRTVKGGGAARLFELPNVHPDEPVVSLASFRGKPVVLNFWASWCVPCRKEMPAFQAVAEQVSDRVAFVGVNHQDSRRLAVDLLADTGVRYPSGYDPGGKVAAAYGLFGMPTTLFISPEGRILERRTGEMSRQDLERAIERLFLRGGGPPRPTSLRIGGDDIAVAELAGAAAGLCEARQQATSDPPAARAIFFDRAHGPLHTIARGVEALDRRAAGAVLRAKQAVESDLATPAAPEKLLDDLERLAEATRGALRRLGVSAADCMP
ncbi:MAG: TlpA family protein disulfide reductase [Actinomycetota bacterium]|nr:TlpA family protein disulfide reductase [Actinomycetota bacterium]